MLLSLLKSRTSVRRFIDQEISGEIINYILEAGRLSPSGGNEQAWIFGVINENALIKEISQIAYNQKWIESAKLLIVLCTRIVPQKSGGRFIQSSRFPDFSNIIESMSDDVYSRLNMEEHQTKIPGTHMILAALEHGIGSTWISYFDVDKLSKFLNLPSDCIASEIIAFGYPEANYEMTEKKKIEDIVFYNKYTPLK